MLVESYRNTYYVNRLQVSFLRPVLGRNFEFSFPPLEIDVDYISKDTIVYKFCSILLYNVENMFSLSPVTSFQRFVLLFNITFFETSYFLCINDASAKSPHREVTLPISFSS